MDHALKSERTRGYATTRARSTQEMLRELYRRIVVAIEPIDPNFELILVEDYGGDDSWSVIRELARDDPRIQLMSSLPSRFPGYPRFNASYPPSMSMPNCWKQFN